MLCVDPRCMIRNRPSMLARTDHCEAKSMARVPLAVGPFSAIRTEFLSTSDPRWNWLVDKVPHDVYHLPEYCERMAEGERGEALLFVAAEDERLFLAPIIVRPLPHRFT